MRLHRPSHATVVAYIALFFAMSGTAVAATGGTFILGKSNSATATTSLTNTAGTALKVTSKSGYPPLSVGTNKLLVPYLNADLLDGLTSANFLRSTGKAADANLLDGVDSTGFLAAGGTAVNSSALSGHDASYFQQSLHGSFVLSNNYCPSGTFYYGSYNLTDSYGYSSSFMLCSIY